jgi:hypothetical protein
VSPIEERTGGILGRLVDLDEGDLLQFEDSARCLRPRAREAAKQDES